MAKTIKPEDLAKAINQELTTYHKDKLELVDQAGEAAVKKLVKLTRSKAPVGARGDFKRHIAWKLLSRTAWGSKFLWYVKKPDHRLTHLLVKGHATPDGGRTKADPFLEDSLAVVLPEYEEAVEEAFKK